MSRPTKLTETLHTQIVKDISLGVSYVDASGAAGIEYDTFRNWMNRGKAASKLDRIPKKEKIYFSFFVAVEAAKSQAFTNFTKVITKASMDGDWRAALEYLKRHDPENWGDSNKVDVTSNGKAIKIEVEYINGAVTDTGVPSEPTDST